MRHVHPFRGAVKSWTGATPAPATRRMSRLLLLLLLPLLGLVTLAANMPPCAHDEYETLHRCCRLCPAGHYVSRDCDEFQQTECDRCPSGTFLPFANQETQCWACRHCRQDQEVAAECSPTSDRRCQCRQGHFFCDSADCVEQCYRCRSCAGGSVLQRCNVTTDTVCGEGKQVIWYWLGPVIAVLLIIISIITVVGVGIFICRNRGSAGASAESSRKSSPPDQAQPPEDTEQGQPAPCEQLKALMQIGDPASAPGHPDISEDPVEGIELLEVVANGKPTHVMRTRQCPVLSDPESADALPHCSGVGLLSISEDSPGRSAPRLSPLDDLHTADHPTAQHGGPAEGLMGFTVCLCLLASAESQVWKRNSEPQHSAGELRSCFAPGSPDKETLPDLSGKVREEVYLHLASG